MKKRQSSPSVASIVAEFEKRQQQSMATPATSKIAKSDQKSPLPKHPEQVTDARRASQESPTAQTRVAPQRPPRARDRQKNLTATQESPTAQTRVAPQRPPRARDKELNISAVTQKNETLYDTPAPPKPARIKDRAQNNAAPQENEPIYAEIAIKTSASTRYKEKRDAITQKEETIYTTAVSAKVNTSLSKEELISKIRNNPLVQTCKDEIKNLSQTVYGNPEIFQKKLEEIEKNPVLGESLSWQVAASPKLVAPLAGKKVFGVKNQTRKQAEENISALCFAIENYAEIVKQAKEGILHGHLAKQTHHKPSLDLKQMAKVLQKPRKAEQETATLSQKEMLRRIKSNTTVQYCHAEIVYWCTMTFGDPRILQYRLEEVQKSPAMGEELAWQVTTYPHIFGKLAGRNFSGIKNQARKDAENALIHLGAAIEGYAEAIKHAQEDIVKTSDAQQKHHTQSTEQEKSTQKQQSPTKSPLPEHSAKNRHQEAAKTSSMQAEWEQLGARPRTGAPTQEPALQQTQESVLSPSYTEQEMQKQQMAEGLQKSFTATKAKAPLSHKEISDRVQSDHAVQRTRIEVYNWCNIVYNDPFILKFNTKDVQKIPVLGEELAWQVAKQPAMFAPLAGKQVLGIKNSARKHAEGAIPSLCAAIGDYTKAVKQAREEIVKTHQEQSMELDQDSQKQQNLSQTSQLSERSPVERHSESAKASIQAEKSPPSVRPCKVTASTTISFSG
ncbi:BID domain-containing T4SS effector [Bartonella florencae]|uniref:BID domain-containing T4SS effector n=1 Tax=Bartonella florencae TaxID=928210 RepID=UPI000314CD8A|nr:BID domain-containing T4SS effector [Bartonella florencae]